MDALSEIFREYDAIRHDAPPWHPHSQSQTTLPPLPQPQAQAPPPQALPQPPQIQEPPPQPLPEPIPTTTSQTNRAELDRLGFQGKKNWNDVRADKEAAAQQLLEERLKESGSHIDKQNALIEERLHESHANKLLNDRIAMPNGGVTFKQDEKGMDAAYGYKSFPGAAYDENTGTLYIAGSDSWRSWWDDFTKIPEWGNLTDAERYKQAERAYDDLTQKYGKSVKRVVGHSLGGSVALELAKNKDIPFSRTFGAPVVDINPFHRGKVDRYRHPLDPVSIADRGATWGELLAYPHSYGGFQHLDKPNPQPIRGLNLPHKTLALRMRNLI